MRVIDPGGLPRRELVEAEVSREFGLCWLTISVHVQAGVSKRTGEVRYRTLRTKYRVETPRDAAGVPLAGVVNLVKDTGETYEVTRWACSCRDTQFRRVVCKHREALAEVGLLDRGGVIAQQ